MTVFKHPNGNTFRYDFWWQGDRFGGCRTKHGHRKSTLMTVPFAIQPLLHARAFDCCKEVRFASELGKFFLSSGSMTGNVRANNRGQPWTWPQSDRWLTVAKCAPLR